jgi:antitoxin MazE
VILEPAAPGYDLGALLAGITEENLHSEVDFGTSEGRELL